jgi:hypothetical protein
LSSTEAHNSSFSSTFAASWPGATPHRGPAPRGRKRGPLPVVSRGRPASTGVCTIATSLTTEGKREPSAKFPALAPLGTRMRRGRALAWGWCRLRVQGAFGTGFDAVTGIAITRGYTRRTWKAFSSSAASRARITPARGNRICRLALLASAFAVISAPPIPAQTAQTANAPLPSFEVATIKKSRPGDPPWGPSFRPGRFTGRAQTIILVIAPAYNVYPLKIFGAPSWVSSERYDIQAKESDATAEELRKLPPAKVMEKQALLLHRCSPIGSALR